MLVGPSGFKTFHRTFCETFPELRVTIDDIIAEDDKVAIRWTAEMTHLGDGLGFPASGKKVRLPGATFILVKNGKIDAGWDHMDMGEMVAQLRAT